MKPTIIVIVSILVGLLASCDVALETSNTGTVPTTPAITASPGASVAPAASPSPSPIAVQPAMAAWSFDSFLDSSANTSADSISNLVLSPNTAANLACFTLEPGLAGNALRLSQTSAINYYLTKPAAVPADHPLNTASTTLSLEGWVKFDSTVPATSTSAMYLIDRTAFQLYLSGSAGEQNTLQFKATIGGTAKTVKYTAETVQAGSWYHVAAVFNGSTLELYINGSPKASIAAVGTLAVSSSANLKFGGTDSANANKNVNGLMDEWRLYNAVLSQAEVLARYQALASAAGTPTSPAPSASPAASSAPTASPSPLPSPSPSPAPTTLPIGGSIITVSSTTQWTTAMANIKAGDTVIINTNLNTSLKIQGKLAIAGSPITIKASDTGNIRLTGFTIDSCEHVVLEGFRFVNMAGDAVKIYASNNLAIRRNYFDYTGVAAAGNAICTASGGTSTIEIAYNSFDNRTLPGTWSGSYIKSSYQPVAGTYPAGIATNMWMHHNYFANMPAQPVASPGGTTWYGGDSDRETIIMGSSGTQAMETNNLIEHNLFVNCDGEGEMISVKVAKVTVRYNTIINSMGSVCLRNGANSEVYGNFFLADAVSDFSEASYPFGANYETGGVRAYGVGHKIYNNYFQNLTGGLHSSYQMPIMIDGGDSDALTASSHQRPQNVLVANNTFVNCQYSIGLDQHYTLTPKNITIADNLVVNPGVAAFLVSSKVEAESTNSFIGNLVKVGSGSLGTTTAVIAADPALASTTINGYSLWLLASAASPAVNAALSPTADALVTTDLFGATRVTRDIGAEEFGGSRSRLPLSTSQVGPLAL